MDSILYKRGSDVSDRDTNTVGGYIDIFVFVIDIFNGITEMFRSDINILTVDDVCWYNIGWWNGNIYVWCKYPDISDRDITVWGEDTPNEFSGK